jgi:hypothetical protein
MASICVWLALSEYAIGSYLQGFKWAYITRIHEMTRFQVSESIRAFNYANLYVRRNVLRIVEHSTGITCGLL